MDGIHDLGGKQGFGPIAVSEPAEPFHHVWEGRMWAIARTCGAPDWTIDWWRHVRERMDPVDYLTRAYFDQWCQTYMAAFITSDIFTLAEAVSGHTDKTGDPAQPLSPAEVHQMNRNRCRSFELPVEHPPAFAPGDTVHTKSTISANHTRLPQYARGRTGTVHARHGAHSLPDRSAAGEEIGEHLYTVAFTAPELWGVGADTRDVVFLDLWESYLDAA